MKLGIVGNLEKKELPKVVLGLLEKCEKEGIEYVLSKSLAKRIREKKKAPSLNRAPTVADGKIAASCDILVALGGDGTILRVARDVGKQGTPILGVNLGKLGFLAEVSLEELEACFGEILNGDYLIEERMMLEAGVVGKRERYSCLNDIVVDKYGSSRLIDIETYVNGEYLATFTADGIILSTPTGSTAYSLASNGPVVTPTNRAITINPLCPHTLTVRPVIVPDDSMITLKIEAAPKKIHLTADGQVERLFKPPIEIRVQKAPFTAKLVKRRNTSYYDVLRKKLQWGRDLRLES